MNESDNSNYKDLHGACESDKQIYTELNQPQPDHNVYYELHQPDEQRGSSQQQLQAPPSVNKELQQVSKLAIFQVVSQILILLLLMGIIVSLILITTTTPAVLDPESVQYLLSQQVAHLQNNTNTVNLIQQSSENTTQKLINIVSTLNNLKGTSTSTAGVVDDILLVVEELLEIQNASVLFNSIQPVSCKDIKTVLPNSPTGYYHVNSRNIYCNMGELCGTGGGWTRLAYLDMSDSTVNCPTGFRLYQSGGVNACGRPYSSGGNCSSVQYPSNGISYSQICGRVVGYQYGSTDAAWMGSNDINSYYVDGVSITRGSPRQHVWTLMAGLFDSRNHNANCPCNTPPSGSQHVQSFVGSNYYCESGNSHDTWTGTLYTGDPLWDGQGCGTNETVCCSAPGLPWFHRDYGNVTTTDYIELRVCGAESTTNEDVPVSFYEIYVK